MSPTVSCYNARVPQMTPETPSALTVLWLSLGTLAIIGVVSRNCRRVDGYIMLGADDPPFNEKMHRGLMIHFGTTATLQGWPKTARVLYTVRGKTYSRWSRSALLKDISVALGVCLAAVCPPVLMLTFRRRWLRPIAGRCSRCNYDLRATPDRCPECGAIPTQLRDVRMHP
jgi:hypothetical protein